MEGQQAIVSSDVTNSNQEVKTTTMLVEGKLFEAIAA